MSNDGVLRVWHINLQTKKLKVIKEVYSKAGIVGALDLNNNSDFVVIDDQGYLGYINIYLNEEEYVRS